MEKSCGAVIFTRDHGDIRYVIIRSKNGVYGFSKGHMEGNETEEQTALREIKEETGLDVTLLDGFRTTDAYVINVDGKPTVQKEIAYFVAEFSNQTPRIQESELSEIHILSFEDAMNTLVFESSKRILREADAFLKKKLK